MKPIKDTNKTHVVNFKAGHAVVSVNIFLNKVEPMFGNEPMTFVEMKAKYKNINYFNKKIGKKNKSVFIDLFRYEGLVKDIDTVNELTLRKDIKETLLFPSYTAKFIKRCLKNREKDEYLLVKSLQHNFSKEGLETIEARLSDI